MSERPDTPAWIQAVTPAEIARQRSHGWPDFHPEDFCHRCGHRNPVWWVVGGQWRTGTSRLPRGTAEILCPSCFCAEWQAVTGLRVIWELRLDPQSRALRESLPPRWGSLARLRWWKSVRR